ncbi:MFS transporter [Tenacibaculum mesophilum]|uniref:MFS transporter n=1 Tax=Tenacibaculum mesophilum TaxID=104268 RepID=UPI003747C24E
MNQKIKILKIIHLALITGITLAFTFLGNFKTMFDMVIDDSSLFYAFIPAIAYVTSNFIFKNMLRNIQKDASNEEKLAIYQSASIARWAIIEGACFLILILKPDFLLLGVILLIYLILLAPKKAQIFQTLDIRS